MIQQVFEDLYAFLWDDFSQNNCNTYLINRDKKILIDPGHDHLLNQVEKNLSHIRLSLNDIDFVLVTHGHPDHIGGVPSFPEKTKFAISEKEYQFINSVSRYSIQAEPDFFLNQGQITIGDLSFEVIETPGHSPGSVCLYWPERKTLFTGDLVFNQGLGRTDLAGGSTKELKDSVQRVQSLDVEVLLCGHGDILAGKEAVENNFSFVQQLFVFL